MPENQQNLSTEVNLIVFPSCDPGSALSRIFINDRINHKPEYVILNWLVSLPSAIDPAVAANTMLLALKRIVKKVNLDKVAENQLSHDQANLMNLLTQVASHPRKSLVTPKVRRRRLRHRRA